VSAAGPLDRPHLFRPGGAKAALLLLHGTGGDEHDLLPLGRALRPDAALLSVRGSVLEGTAPRFFRRLREGVFDEDDLSRRAGELAAFVRAATAHYAISEHPLTVVGFSNGANIGSALLAENPAGYAGAVLFGAMPPYRNGFAGADLDGTPVIVSNGARDPIATPALTETLVSQLTAAGAHVQRVPHSGGHQIDPSSVATIADLLLRAPFTAGHAGPPGEQDGTGRRGPT
jgi:phospholipase/carboxylesterase